MRKFLSFFCLITCFAFGGKSQFVLEGIVRDSLSNQAIAFANVILKGSFRGVSADVNGDFRLDVGSLPVTLIVSTLGHRARTVLVDQSPVEILLQPLIRELPTAIVDDDPYREILGDPLQTVLDFAFYDDKVLALVRRFGKEGGKRIDLITEEGTTISSLPVNQKAEGLYTDCMSFVHLLLPDSVYQVYYDYEELSLVYPERRPRFHYLMDRCEGALGNELFFRFPAYRGLQMKFLRAIEGEMTEFFSLEDSVKMEYMRREFNLAYYLGLRRLQDPRVQMSVDQIKANLDNLRMTEQLDWVNSKILSEVYSPLQTLKNEVIILDFANDRWIQFDRNLRVIDTKAISFHRQVNWKQKLVKDVALDELYTVFEQGSETTLAKIDPESLELGKRFPLPGKGYVEGLKIRNSTVWFVDKDLEQPGIYRLFNLPLQ